MLTKEASVNVSKNNKAHVYRFFTTFRKTND